MEVLRLAINSARATALGTWVSLVVLIGLVEFRGVKSVVFSTAIPAPAIIAIGILTIGIVLISSPSLNWLSSNVKLLIWIPESKTPGLFCGAIILKSGEVVYVRYEDDSPSVSRQQFRWLVRHYYPGWLRVLRLRSSWVGKPELLELRSNSPLVGKYESYGGLSCGLKVYLSTPSVICLDNASLEELVQYLQANNLSFGLEVKLLLEQTGNDLAALLMDEGRTLGLFEEQIALSIIGDIRVEAWVNGRWEYEHKMAYTSGDSDIDINGVNSITPA